MAINLATKYYGEINNRFMSGNRVDSDWEPITYTSMTGWMFLNYSLLLLMFVLPISFVYMLVELFK